MTEKLALLPCPFCGGAADFEEIGDGGATCQFSVGCTADEADCMGYQSIQTFARRCDAAKAWNKRAISPPEPLTAFDFLKIAGEAERRFAAHNRGVRGQVVSEKDSRDYWYAAVAHEFATAAMPLQDRVYCTRCRIKADLVGGLCLECHDVAHQTKRLIELYDMLRSAAVGIKDEFNDCGGHFEFTGTMANVHWLREAVEEVEQYMEQNDIPVPQAVGEKP